MHAPTAAMQPATLGLRSGTVRLSTGPALHYVEQGDRTGEPVVFVHGWPDSWASYSRILPLLAPTYHAYAIDQRGFGDSERPPVGYTIDQYAAETSSPSWTP